MTILSITAGVECITFDREADIAMAHLLRTRPGGYAILGADSDFFLMEGVRYIPFCHLDICGGDGDVMARVYTPELVAGSLSMPVDRLADLASLCGNDTTDAYLDKHPIVSLLGLEAVTPRHKPSPRVTPSVAAAFIASLPGGIEEHAIVARFASEDPAFARALSESRFINRRIYLCTTHIHIQCV